MKRVITILLVITMVMVVWIYTQHTVRNSASDTTETSKVESSSTSATGTDNDTQETLLPADHVQPEFASLSDPALLQYVKDNIYSDLVDRFNSEDYIIEDISVIYVSEDYLEEVAYNSKANIYFGYTLKELDAQFQGTRYVFSLGKNGETVVEEFAAYDDTYDRVIKNVSMGTGIILACVTVSVVSGGVGAPAAVSMIFASAAKTGTIYALSSGTISAVAAATIKGIQTGDFEEAKKAAALAGSESFKWGAITGVIVDGATKAVALYHNTSNIPSPKQSEDTVLSRTKGGVKQVSYLDGVEVPANTPGSTRPDIVVKNPDGTVRAIEVKNYNLSNPKCVDSMLRELKRQTTSRLKNLPAGSTQEIVLDVRGRNLSYKDIKKTRNEIEKALKNVLGPKYKKPKIKVMWY
ncbi:MAG TPA: hypothetical protein PK630_03370 [Fervidobacterium sp.]|nr:hypothetical protein [Fervidobacterium sp.]